MKRWQRAGVVLSALWFAIVYIWRMDNLTAAAQHGATFAYEACRETQTEQHLDILPVCKVETNEALARLLQGNVSESLATAALSLAIAWLIFLVAIGLGRWVAGR